MFFFSFKPDNIVENIKTVSFAGLVTQIDTGRGFKVKLEGNSNLYVLSGACNDTLCLAEVIQLGDSLIKDFDKPIIILKSKNRKTIRFLLK